MISIGITGGIGSGKSTVTKRWKERGAYVVFADDLAKRLMVEDEELIQQLKEAFGEQTYNKQGELNRSYLTKEAFQKGRVETLNQLVHPKVHEATRQLMQEAEEQEYDLFVYEAALLLDHGRPNHFDVVVLVLADEEKRIERVAKRDQQDEDTIRSKIERQRDFESLTDLADYVIQNDGTLEDLIDKADYLYDKLYHLAQA
jgi:dephospho-CoA kinase